MLAITIYMPQGGLPWEIAVLLYDKCGFVLPIKFSIELVIYTTYTPCLKTYTKFINLYADKEHVVTNFFTLSLQFNADC